MAQLNSLLSVFLLLLCSTLCVSVCAGSTEKNVALEANVFASKTKITDVQTVNKPGSTIDITPEKIQPPALFAATEDGVVVVIAETKYKNGASVGAGGEDKVDVVSRTFETKGQSDWGEKVFKEKDKTKWKTQLATENKEKANDFSKIMASTVNTDGSKVYVFLLNITKQGGKKWKFRLVEGTVDGKTGQKTIKWEKESFILTKDDEDIKNEVNKDGQDFSLTDGSVFLTGKEEQVVFVFKETFTGTGNSVVRSVIIFFQLKKQGAGGNELEFLKAKSVDGSYSFFQWKGEIFRTPTDDQSSGDQNNEVMVLKNNEFARSDKSIARLRDFLKDKQNFAAAKIGRDNNKVLLFTQQTPDSGGKNVYLWMSDGTRVVNLGIIITDVKKFFYGSLLRTETELFALYQTYEPETATGDLTGDDNKIYLTILNTQLEDIRNTLDAWKNNSEKIKKIYKGLATAMNPRFTDGLVGFLSNTNEDTTWKNEYSNMDATVHGAGKNKVDDGFTFSGAGAGAVWPATKTENNEQPYNLKDFGLTLVATVKIDSDAKEKKNTILGIVMEEGSDGSNQKSISLWCSSGKWGVSDGNNQAVTSSITKTCVKDGTYQVALMLNGNTFSVHIGAEQLHKIEDKTNQLRDIKHFYFGADIAGQQDAASIAESHVTVTNVLLYNRPLPTNEIKNLKEYVKPVKEIKAVEQNVDTNTTGNSDEVPSTLPPSSEKEKNKKEPSPSRTEDGGVGGGVRVFSLLLALLCVSAPLLHL